MARVKGGLNAKKKHKRVLKLAKGYRGARIFLCRQKREKASVQTALDCAYQCGCTAEWFILQQVYVWPEAGGD